MKIMLKFQTNNLKEAVNKDIIEAIKGDNYLAKNKEEVGVVKAGNDVADKKDIVRGGGDNNIDKEKAEKQDKGDNGIFVEEYKCSIF